VTGAVLWQWQGNAFGDTQPTGSSADLINLRFPGQYYDDESGLYYNWNRYYDPRTGRYITSDPIGLDGGLNTYGYVGGNPGRHTDPTGFDGGIDDCSGWGTTCASPAQKPTDCDCTTYKIKYGPLTREQADSYNNFRGDVNNVVSTAGGTAVGALADAASGGNPYVGVTAGAASSVAIGGALNRHTPHVNPGDSIETIVTVCPNDYTDSGITVTTEDHIIRSGNQ